MQHAVAAAWSDFETVWQRAVAHVVKVEQHGEYRDVISALALMGSLWEKRTRALGMVSAPSVHVDASQRTANVTQLISSGARFGTMIEQLEPSFPGITAAIVRQLTAPSNDVHTE